MTCHAFRPQATALALAASLLAAAAGCAHAETSPYYIGARETVTHDTNVDRVPNGVSDTVLSTGIFGGIDQPIGRQRLSGSLSANWNRYQNVDRLNHTDGNAQVRLDWESIEHLSGDVQVNHNQSLYRDFGSAASAGQKILVRTTDAAFDARLGVVTRWTLEAGISGSRTRFDNDVLSSSDIDYDTYRGGIRFTPSDLLQLGLGARHTTGKYPHTVAGAARTDFSRDDVDLTANWNPTGTSTLNSRVSRSRLSYDSVSARSTSLTTGALTYRWHPGGRLALNASVQRDSNAGQYGFDSLALVGGEIVLRNNTSVDTRVATTAALSASYEVTAKIHLGLDARQIERKLDNALTQTTAGLPTTVVQSTSDCTNSYSLTATYDPTRNLRLSCGYGHTARSVGDNAGGLTYPYSVNQTNCMVQFAVQP